VSTIFLTLQSWSEIESIDPVFHDVMTIRLVDVNSGAILATHVINENISPADGVEHEGHSSGGFNAPPVFEVIDLEASNVGGRTVRLEFQFQTLDPLYNGFRGWIVDNIRVASTPAGPPSASRLMMKLCGATGCERPAPARRQ
jgi:hypothetical protein